VNGRISVVGANCDCDSTLTVGPPLPVADGNMTVVVTGSDATEIISSFCIGFECTPGMRNA